MIAGGYITLQGRANDPDGDSIIGWHWELDAAGDGNPSAISGATTPNPTFTAESPGLYILTLVVDDGVESSAPDFTVITVANNQQPVAVAEADQTSGPSPLTVNFNGIESTEPDFRPLTYSWDFGDGHAGEGPRVTHQYSIPGIYLVTLLAADDHGAVDHATLVVTVAVNGTAQAVDAVPVLDILSDEDAVSENSAAAGIRGAGADRSRVADAAAIQDALMDESVTSENATTADLMPDSVQFDAAGYSVVEDGMTALVWVTRTGSSMESVTVGYATDDFTATAGSDYTATSGTLSFTEGVTLQSVRVPILNDSKHEKTESFVLFLYNVTGRVSLETRRVAFVNIIDNDAVASGTVSVTDPALMPDPVPATGIVQNTQ